MAQMNIEVPGELNNIAKVAQVAISHLAGGQNFMAVASTDLLPALFAEGGKMDEIKKELKDPSTLVWAAMIGAGLAVKYAPAGIAKVKELLAKRKAGAAPPAAAGAALPA